MGWAWGFAAVQRLDELDGNSLVAQAHPGLSNLAVSAVATVGAAAAMLVSQPSTIVHVWRGSGSGSAAGSASGSRIVTSRLLDDSSCATAALH